MIESQMEENAIQMYVEFESREGEIKLGGETLKALFEVSMKNEALIALAESIYSKMLALKVTPSLPSCY